MVVGRGDLGGDWAVRRDADCFCYAERGHAPLLDPVVLHAAVFVAAVDAGNASGAAAGEEVSTDAVEKRDDVVGAFKRMCWDRADARGVGCGLGDVAESVGA